MVIADDIIINEGDGSALVTVRLLNEIEGNFTLSYETMELPDGATGTFYMHRENHL